MDMEYMEILTLKILNHLEDLNPAGSRSLSHEEIADALKEDPEKVRITLLDALRSYYPLVCGVYVTDVVAGAHPDECLKDAKPSVRGLTEAGRASLDHGKRHNKV